MTSVRRSELLTIMCVLPSQTRYRLSKPTVSRIPIDLSVPELAHLGMCDIQRQTLQAKFAGIRC